MIDLLQRYIQIQTAHPYPDYQQVIRLFSAYASSDGFDTEIIELSSKKQVLIISYQGTDKQEKGLLLNHHMDVVPAYENQGWTVHPFQGIVSEEKIIGRGTQDMKGVAVAHYGAMKQLKNMQRIPRRTIYMSFVPDEEIGGFEGTKLFVDHERFEALDVGYVLDEGMPSGNKNELLIKIQERTPVQIRLISVGYSAHAASLQSYNALHQLIDLLGEITKFQKSQVRLTENQDKGDLISMQITRMNIDNQMINVIPSRAEAYIDARLPDQVSYQAFIAWFEQMVKPYSNITYEVVATSIERSAVSSVQSDFYQKLRRSIEKRGFCAVPLAFEATTDLRFYHNKNIEGLGITPFTIDANLHGIDEAIYVKDLFLGIEIFTDFLIDFCC